MECLCGIFFPLEMDGNVMAFFLENMFLIGNVCLFAFCLVINLDRVFFPSEYVGKHVFCFKHSLVTLMQKIYISHKVQCNIKTCFKESHGNSSFIANVLGIIRKLASELCPSIWIWGEDVIYSVPQLRRWSIFTVMSWHSIVFAYVSICMWNVLDKPV